MHVGSGVDSEGAGYACSPPVFHCLHKHQRLRQPISDGRVGGERDRVKKVTVKLDDLRELVKILFLNGVAAKVNAPLRVRDPRALERACAGEEMSFA